MRTILLPFAALALALTACGGSDSLGACTGQCAPAFSDDWYPYLVWFGPADSKPPDCPAVLPHPDLGWIDNAPTLQCAPCSCGPSAGSCLLPQQMNASTGAMCGGTTLPFDAPSDWDGACTSMDALPSASSLDAPPPYLGQVGQCMGSSSSPVSASGTGRSVVCIADEVQPTPPPCPNAGDMCTYAAVPGFSVCLNQFGDVPCPEGWPIKHLEWPDYYDCDCACGPPIGEVCTSTLTVYSDSMCTEPVGSAMLSYSVGDVCIETVPDSPLGSKQATAPLYQSGTCTGSLVPSQVTTLCCLP